MILPTVEITAVGGPQLKVRQNLNFRSHAGTDVYRNKSTKKKQRIIGGIHYFQTESSKCKIFR